MHSLGLSWCLSPLTTIPVAMASALAVGVGIIALVYRDLDAGISRSEFELPFIDDLDEDSGEQNILIMVHR